MALFEAKIQLFAIWIDADGEAKAGYARNTEGMVKTNTSEKVLTEYTRSAMFQQYFGRRGYKVVPFDEITIKGAIEI